MIGSVRIVADENIPYIREAFGPLGRIDLVSGRSITRAIVQDADILLVRSVTKVDEPLLAGTRVKFVATATIGTDHIDEPYLHRAGITFASAAGSNSNSVAEYITAALLTLAHHKKFTLAGKSIGVIGVGNVGSKVAHKCRQLGMTVFKNDPPLKDLTKSSEYVEVDDFIATADFITTHTPLTLSGPYPTRYLVDERFLSRMKAEAYLFNSSRGGVVKGEALKNALDQRRIAGAVLDVWEREPDIDVELLKRVDLGTPHIAGYSFDGKVNGTEMIYIAACRFLGIEPAWKPATILPAPIHPLVNVACEGNDACAIYPTVKTLYDLEGDDARLREIIALPAEQRPKYFDQLRKLYPVRREFFNTRLTFDPQTPEALRTVLLGLGFKPVGG